MGDACHLPRQGARSAPGVFAVSVCLYLTCTIAWALDISITRTDLYHVIPNRLSRAGLEEDSSTLDNARLNGTKMFVRLLCEGVVVSICISVLENIAEAECHLSSCSVMWFPCGGRMLSMEDHGG